MCWERYSAEPATRSCWACHFGRVALDHTDERRGLRVHLPALRVHRGDRLDGRPVADDDEPHRDLVATRRRLQCHRHALADQVDRAPAGRGRGACVRRGWSTATRQDRGRAGSCCLLRIDASERSETCVVGTQPSGCGRQAASRRHAPVGRLRRWAWRSSRASTRSASPARRPTRRSTRRAWRTTPIRS
jgi:hypothetical protein